MKMFVQKRKSGFVFILLGIIPIALKILLLYKRHVLKSNEQAKESMVSRRDPLNVSTFQTKNVKQDNSATVTQTKKFYIAFSYWEQMTMATTNRLPALIVRLRNSVRPRTESLIFFSLPRPLPLRHSVILAPILPVCSESKIAANHSIDHQNRLYCRLSAKLLCRLYTIQNSRH